MNENQLQRLREYIDNHQNARRDATWAALCEAFGTHGFATSEDEVPGDIACDAREARRWHPVMHGRGLVQSWRLEDQDGNRFMQEGNQLWTGTRSQAHERARALNRQELGI